MLSLALILVKVINEYGGFLVKISICLISEVIDVMATGMLPAVFLTFLTDIIISKHKKNEYLTKLKCKKKSLEESYTEMPSEILAYINTPGYAEGDEKKTYYQWCEMYFNDKNRSKESLKNYFGESRQLLEETVKYYSYVSEYESAIVEDERQNELAKIKKVIDILKSFRMSYLVGGNKNYVNEIKKFIGAVLELFDETDEFPKVKKFYTEKFNSEDFDE